MNARYTMLQLSLYLPGNYLIVIADYTGTARSPSSQASTRVVFTSYRGSFREDILSRIRQFPYRAVGKVCWVRIISAQALSFGEPYQPFKSRVCRYRQTTYQISVSVL